MNTIEDAVNQAITAAWVSMNEGTPDLSDSQKRWEFFCNWEIVRGEAARSAAASFLRSAAESETYQAELASWIAKTQAFEAKVVALGRDFIESRNAAGRDYEAKRNLGIDSIVRREAELSAPSRGEQEEEQDFSQTM